MRKSKRPVETETEAVPKKLKMGFTAKNKEQREAIRSIVEKPISFILGSPGSGKSFLTIGIMAEWLIRGKIDKLIISRPLEFTGKNLGALPGDIEEKTCCWFIHVKDYLVKFLGSDLYKQLKLEEKIVYQPLEILRGLNLEKSTLVVDECQNVSWEQCKAALTRIGDDESRIVLMGDVDQPDIKSPCIEELLKKLSTLEEVGITYLKESFRHPVVEKIAKIL